MIWRVVTLGIAVASGIAVGGWLDGGPPVCPDGAQLRWTKVGVAEELEIPDADLLACWTTDGTMTGPWVKWLGRAMWQAGYAKDGRHDGSAFMWRGDGRRDRVSEWNEGEAGSFTSFDEEGNLVRDWKKLEGDAALVQTWHPNGRLKSRIEWLGDGPHGLSESWHANGHAASQGTYTAGKRIGAWTCWNEDGSRTVERAYSNAGRDPAAPVVKEAWIWPCYGWPGLQAEGAPPNPEAYEPS